MKITKSHLRKIIKEEITESKYEFNCQEESTIETIGEEIVDKLLEVGAVTAGGEYNQSADYIEKVVVPYLRGMQRIIDRA